MIVPVILNTRGRLRIKVEYDQWANVLNSRKISPVFLCDFADPLDYPGFGELVKALDEPWTLYTQLSGWIGYRALRSNEQLIKRCLGIHAVFVHPINGGSLSLKHFLGRYDDLYRMGYEMHAYLPGPVGEGNVPRSWRPEGLEYTETGPWSDWRLGSGGRVTGNTCNGSLKVIGPDLFVYPCVVAACGVMRYGVYRGNDMREEGAEFEHEGRTECALRSCPNGPERDTLGAFRHHYNREAERST